MTRNVLQHIKQSKSFSSPQEEAFLMIIRIAENFLYELDHMLKEHGLTQTQYNALRILRGAGEAGLPCNEIGSRMVKRVPDVTRLLDRLEKSGYVCRNRQEQNRRVVIARITPEGAELVNKLETPINNFTSQCFSTIDTKQTEQLAELLDQLQSSTSG